MNQNQEMIKLFWYFVNERQNIWYKRFVLKQDPPWTDDIILIKNKFTNIFRILDRNTQYLVNNILNRKESDKEILFNIFVFRLFNRIDTYEEIGWQKIETFDINNLSRILHEKEDKDEKSVFCTAYMTTGVHFGSNKNKIDSYLWVLNNICTKIDFIYSRIKNSEFMQSDWNYLKNFVGIGGFLAQQLLVDISYTNIVKYDNNKWTWSGSGSLLGISYLFNDKVNYLDALKYLKEQQKNYLKEFHYDIPIPSYIKHSIGFISLNDLENCCCEFSKYLKLKNNIGKKRKLFIPNKNELVYQNVS